MRKASSLSMDNTSSRKATPSKEATMQIPAPLTSPTPKSSGRSNSSSSGQRTYQVSGTAAAVVGSKTIQSKNGQMSAIRRKN
ncbi:hypothetical protein N7468_008216 [Penicillium chermesinum]|uniref:Uncharacterized protein n=1 Tax=Penicillium chermesinum TaxID=63820 RepID=A0A9W9NS80_9EURO|nr:uncharacterized protein N7468_008216 [Penicillium chermesinum]KAJ5223674.1 hypothetical protein N7468_008216 [Penicillium chermesinum]